VSLDIGESEMPASARLISLPDRGSPVLNGLHVVRGQLPSSTDSNVVAVTDPFFKANGLALGDSLVAVINGSRQKLKVVATVLSPEFVYVMRAGDLVPDDKHYGVIWMRHGELASAMNMTGAFNDVSLKLGNDANVDSVVADVDTLLEPFGGLGAYERKVQQSNWFLQNEINQLSDWGMVMPLIFLGVAAFLLNVVIGRMISTQREVIAMLKAFGYSSRSIGIHYMKMVAVIVTIGSCIGVLVGAWMGKSTTEMYTEFYHFPVLNYFISPSIVAIAVLISASAAALGVIRSVWNAVQLPPAEAMRPPAPAQYSPTLVERLGLKAVLSPPTRMILRQLNRRPMRAATTVVGLAFAVAIMVVGLGFMDVIDYTLDVQENVVQREDLTLSFRETRSRSAMHEVSAMEGVVYAEGFRTVPARLRFRHHSRVAGVLGVPQDARLSRVVDRDLNVVHIPKQGLVMSRMLADVLGISEGDTLTIEVLEGAKPTREIRVAGLIDDFMGLNAVMNLDALNDLMREESAISGLWLSIDERHQTEIYNRVKEMPGVAGIANKKEQIKNIDETIASNIGIMMGFFILFAGIIAFGVVYNSARVSLAERSRELASLRVLGLTRSEVSYILLGEQAILTLAAIPLGFVIGYALISVSMTTLDSEIMRFPVVLFPSSYAGAAITVLVASIFSALVVRRHIDRLDMVEVLKTRE
jgi:putative ABC transport system permease protein